MAGQRGTPPPGDGLIANAGGRLKRSQWIERYSLDAAKRRDAELAR